MGAPDARRRPVRTAAVVLLLTTVLLAACSDAEPDGEVTAPTFAPATSAPASPEPSASTEPSEAPSTAQAAPPLPPEATEQTPEGAVAFTEWWFETLNYATATGDTEALRGASDPGCQFCDGQATRAEEAYAGGGHIEGGAARVDVTPPESLRELGASLAVFAEIEPMIVYDSSGEEIDRFAGSESRAVVATTLLVGDRWVMGSVTG